MRIQVRKDRGLKARASCKPVRRQTVPAEHAARVPLATESTANPSKRGCRGICSFAKCSESQVSTLGFDVLTPGHLPRHRDVGQCFCVITHEVPLCSSWNVTAKTVPAKSIDHINGPSFVNSCSIFRHVEREELPIMRCSVEALVMFDHGLGWN